MAVDFRYVLTGIGVWGGHKDGHDFIDNLAGEWPFDPAKGQAMALALRLVIDLLRGEELVKDGEGIGAADPNNTDAARSGWGRDRGNGWRVSASHAPPRLRLGRCGGMAFPSVGAISEA